MSTRLGIAYNMNTKEVLENLGNRVDFPSVSTIGFNHSVRADFVNIYYTKDSETIRRVGYGDSYELVYGPNEPRYLDQVHDASGVLIDSGVLYDFYSATGISFAPEDTKDQIVFNTNKDKVLNDGVDEVLVTAEIKDPALSGIVNESVTYDLPFNVDNNIVYYRFNFINGKASRFIKSDAIMGIKSPETNYRDTGKRINNQINITIIN